MKSTGTVGFDAIVGLEHLEAELRREHPPLAEISFSWRRVARLTLIGLGSVVLSCVVFVGAMFLLAFLGAPLGVSAIVSVALAVGLTLTILIYSCKFGRVPQK